MFLYLNSGYSGLFKNSSFLDMESYTYNEKNGVSVYGGFGDVILPSDVDVLYGKLNFYISSLSFNFFIGVCEPGLINGLIIEIANGKIYYQCKFDNKSSLEKQSVSYDSNILKNNELNSVWFCVVPSTNKYNGFIKIIINDVEIISTYTSLEFDCKSMEIYSQNTNVFLSNFIFSDEAIDLYSEVFSPAVNILSDTDMVLQDDIYIASQSGQKIVQAINVDDLISRYGRNADVTGIAIAGMFNHSEADSVGSMVSVEKYNNNYIVRKKYYLDDNIDYIMDSELLKNMKLDEFINRTYGWIAKS